MLILILFGLFHSHLIEAEYKTKCNDSKKPYRIKLFSVCLFQANDECVL